MLHSGRYHNWENSHAPSKLFEFHSHPNKNKIEFVNHLCQFGLEMNGNIKQNL